MIKINAYKSRATKWYGSRLFIDRKNNHLYAGLDAYKSKDPRERQIIEQIPMSDYKGQKIEVQPCQTNPMPYSIVENTESEKVEAPTTTQTEITPKSDTVFQFQRKRPMNNRGEEGSRGCSPGVDRNMRSSYQMAGRSARSLPAPTYNSNLQGKVLIKIWVDRNGNVTRAEFEPKGSTTSNTLLVKDAKEAALKAKFNADENAPEEQNGIITYIFTI